jgi:hypothetical protein
MIRALPALIALAAVLAAPPASAQTAPGWLGNVAALALAPEGLLVGTFDQGLYVLGRDAQVYRAREPALNQNINALHYDGSNRALWVATARGLVRCQTAPIRECRRFGRPAEVHALLVRHDGGVLAGGEAGLTFIDRAGAVEFTLDRKHGAPFRGVWALAEASDGTLFVGSSNGLHWAAIDRFRSAGPNKADFGRASLVTGQLADDWVTAVAISGDRVIVGLYNAGVAILRRAGHGLESVSADRGLGYVNVAGIRVLPDGKLAVSTMDGLRVGGPGSWQTIATPNPDVTAVLPGLSGARYFVGTRRGVVERGI